MTLYAHRPRSLLPLLREQLPYTTVMVATILANDELPPVYATFSTRDDGYINLGWLESIGVDGWLVTVALPRPSEQIRIYHSAVAKGATPDPDTISLAIREMARMYPEQRMVGETHELLAPLVRGIVGGPERTRTYIYVAPDGGFGLTDIKEADIELDQGLPEDAPTIHATNKYRSEAYYALRGPHTTCIRGSELEAWVMTHGDGSIGALWTQPAYRRRGHAMAVLAAHIRKEEARGVPRFCYIEEGNDASMRLFASLGWTPLPWSVYWI